MLRPLIATLAAALAFSGSALAVTYPTTPVFDPLPAVVEPGRDGSVELGWTSTFWFGWQSAGQRYVLWIESYPPPPWQPTITQNTIFVYPGATRVEGPLARRATARVGVAPGGRYVVKVTAWAMWYTTWNAYVHESEAVKTFELAPPARS